MLDVGVKASSLIVAERKRRELVQRCPGERSAIEP